MDRKETIIAILKQLEELEILLISPRDSREEEQLKLTQILIEFFKEKLGEIK